MTKKNTSRPLTGAAALLAIGLVGEFASKPFALQWAQGEIRFREVEIRSL